MLSTQGGFAIVEGCHFEEFKLFGVLCSRKSDVALTGNTFKQVKAKPSATLIAH